MKKIIFLFAMVLTAGMVMAQQNVWVTQTGYGNTANITQDAERSGVTSSIFAVQSGTWNALNANQLGETNYIDLKQTGANNIAEMKQLTREIHGPGGTNTANVLQSGNANTANLTQREDNQGGYDFSVNYVNAVQSGNNNNYNLNQGRPGLFPYIPNNTSLLIQAGYANSAVMNQSGRHDYSEIRQSGNWNSALLDQRGIDQGDVAPVSSWARSFSWQTGSNNSLGIQQAYHLNNEYAESYQNGTANTTNITQIGFSIQDVISVQHGSGDIINVLQTQ